MWASDSKASASACHSLGLPFLPLSPGHNVLGGCPSAPAALPKEDGAGGPSMFNPLSPILSAARWCWTYRGIMLTRACGGHGCQL